MSSIGYSQTNLLKNPSFEESFTLSSEIFEDWYLDFNTIRTKVTDATDQIYAVKIQTNRPANTGFFAELSAATPSNDLDLENGKTYTISFDYKVVTDTVSILRASLLRDNFYLEHENIVNNLTNTGWQTMTYDFIATHTASHNFDINIKSNSANAEIIIDNASITEKPVDPERAALIALYNATDGPNWVHSWDLNSPDISTWHGVYLNTDGKVNALILNSNNLVGYIPPEIGQLARLEILYLQNNNINGTIPLELGQLIYLRDVGLDFNSLSGKIPKFVSYYLLYFNVVRNQFVFDDIIELSNNIDEKVSFWYENQARIGKAKDIILQYGENYKLSIRESTDPNNTYQWRKNKIPIDNATGSEYLITDYSEDDKGIYDCVILNDVLPKLTITSKPIGIYGEEDGFSPSNLLKNPSFENSSGTASENFDDWYILTNTIRTKVTNATDQTYAVKIQTNTSDSNGFIAELSSATPSNDLAFEIDKTYTISFDYKVETGTVSELKASLLRDSFYLEDENILSDLTSTGWQTMTYDFKATQTAFYNFEIKVKSSTSSTEIILDNASITEKPVNRDREALIAIYNATDGPNWFNTWDLSSIDISTWNGVVLDGDGRVATLDLSSNNLVGTIPPEIGQLSNLELFNVANNELSGTIPQELGLLRFLDQAKLDRNSFSGKIPKFISPSLTNLNVGENHFVFEDIIEVSNNLGENTNFQYSQQASIGETHNLVLRPSENYSLSVNETTHPNNSYQWRMNEIPIDNAIGSEYVITEFSMDDQGVYDCVITNDMLPDLELILNPISILGDDDEDGVANDVDICPNTPSGALVDNRGCSYLDVLVPKPDDITAKVTSTSCPSMNNGEISLNFKVSQTHHVKITGPDNFSENYIKHNGSPLIISNLKAGAYNLLVNSEIGLLLAAPNTEFNLIIETPESFKAGKAVVDHTNKTAKLRVSGSKKYEVTVNKEVFTYTVDNTGIQELSINLQDGFNNIETKTDKICQGAFNQNIVLNKVIVTPNPASDIVKIFGVTNTNKAGITLFNASGLIVKQINKVIKDATTEISIAGLPLGLYTIAVESNEQVIHLKVIKK